jgi:homospermidine synthase
MSSNIKKINISSKKILFLGYGGVAKCVWNYFDMYFVYHKNNVYIVDRCPHTIIGPKLDMIKKKNITVENITTYNFDDYLQKIGVGEGDIIIDLTFNSSTYHFVTRCFELGIHYINTSIEDSTDIMFGTSIQLQQETVRDIYKKMKTKNIRSNVLIECGQNPGLIQHYILHSLDTLSKGKGKSQNRQEKHRKVIDDYKIGTIFCSEIDNITRKSKGKLAKNDTIYNTWSVGGLLSEGFDKTEIVTGGVNNPYIKPVIDENVIFNKKTELLSNVSENKDYNVVFLKEIGVNSLLNSVCPVLDKNGKIVYTTYSGRLIHHGEIFEMAKYFGEKAPFMSYVYQINKDADKSIRRFFKHHDGSDSSDIEMAIAQGGDHFHIFNNFSSKKMKGYDSIGCTIYCGEEKIERIFWCGSILNDHQVEIQEFTPTIVQVAAGVLSGLSYILEKFEMDGKGGLYEPIDLDTTYMLDKSIPLLGDFFFTEIPIEAFDKQFIYSVDKII